MYKRTIPTLYHLNYGEEQETEDTKFIRLSLWCNLHVVVIRAILRVIFFFKLLKDIILFRFGLIERVLFY